jgi:hypothetical protein
MELSNDLFFSKPKATHHCDDNQNKGETTASFFQKFLKSNQSFK